MNVREELLKNQDMKYKKEFHSKLIPNVDSDKIIGVRIPQLREKSERLCLIMILHGIIMKKLCCMAFYRICEIAV